jgi:hypothetical protein
MTDHARSTIRMEIWDYIIPCQSSLIFLQAGMLEKLVSFDLSQSTDKHSQVELIFR